MEHADDQNTAFTAKKKGFLRVPNDLLDDLYSGRPDRCRKARVYLCLLRHAYFTDGEILVNNRKMPCRKGEWITTFRQLEQKTGVPRSNIGTLLDKLADEGAIINRRDGQFTFVKLLRTDKPPLPAAASPPGDPPTGTSHTGKKVQPLLQPPLQLPVNRPNYKRFK